MDQVDEQRAAARRDEYASLQHRGDEQDEQAPPHRLQAVAGADARRLDGSTARRGRRCARAHMTQPPNGGASMGDKARHVEDRLLEQFGDVAVVQRVDHALTRALPNDEAELAQRPQPM